MNLKCLLKGHKWQRHYPPYGSQDVCVRKHRKKVVRVTYVEKVRR